MEALDKKVKVPNILRIIDFFYDIINFFESFFALLFFPSPSSELFNVELIIISIIKAYISPFYFIFNF